MPVPVQPASSKITSSASLEDDIAWSSSTDAFPSQTRTSPTPEPEVTPDDGAHYGTRRTRKRQQQWRKLLWVEQDCKVINCVSGGELGLMVEKFRIIGSILRS